MKWMSIPQEIDNMKLNRIVNNMKRKVSKSKAKLKLAEIFNLLYHKSSHSNALIECLRINNLKTKIMMSILYI